MEGLDLSDCLKQVRKPDKCIEISGFQKLENRQHRELSLRKEMSMVSPRVAPGYSTGRSDPIRARWSSRVEASELGIQEGPGPGGWRLQDRDLPGDKEIDHLSHRKTRARFPFSNSSIHLLHMHSFLQPSIIHSSAQVSEVGASEKQTQAGRLSALAEPPRWQGR